MKQTVADDEAVVFECDLPEPREKVWRALTERELLAKWLLPNDLRPEVGAKFNLRPATSAEPLTSAAPVTRGKPGVRTEPGASVEPGAPVPPGVRAGPGAPVECEVLQVDPGRTLCWRQREPADAAYVESVVRFDLTDLPEGGTHLRVVHDGFTIVARKSNLVSFRPRTKPAIMNCLWRKAA